MRTAAIFLLIGLGMTLTLVRGPDDGLARIVTGLVSDLLCIFLGWKIARGPGD
jgi:hypothetical protein